MLLKEKEKQKKVKVKDSSWWLLFGSKVKGWPKLTKRYLIDGA